MIASEDSDIHEVYKAEHGYDFGFVWFCGDGLPSSLKFSFSFWSSRLSLFSSCFGRSRPMGRPGFQLR